MNVRLFLLTTIVCILGKANDKGTVLLYEPTAFVGTGYPNPKTAGKSNEPKALEVGIFEKTLKEAIATLENSMRKTCAKEMETSISIAAEGKWAVVGVSITGAIKLLILNPEMSQKCGK